MTREPGSDDDTALPPGFIDELKRLDALRELREADAVDPELTRAVDTMKGEGG